MLSNIELFDQAQRIPSDDIVPVELSDGHTVPLHLYAVKNKRDGNSAFIVLRNGAVIHYKRFVSQGDLDETLKLVYSVFYFINDDIEGLKWKQNHPDLTDGGILVPFTVAFALTASDGSVYLFYIEERSYVASRSPIFLTADVRDKFKQFDELTRLMLKREKWIVADPNKILFMLESKVAIGSFRWKLADIHVCNTTEEFMELYNGSFQQKYIETRQSILNDMRLNSIFFRELTEFKNLDFTSPDVIRKYQQDCTSFVPPEGKSNNRNAHNFMKWCEIFLSHLMLHQLDSCDARFRLSISDKQTRFIGELNQIELTPTQAALRLLELKENKCKNVFIPLDLLLLNVGYHQGLLAIDFTEKLIQIYDPNGTRSFIRSYYEQSWQEGKWRPLQRMSKIMGFRIQVFGSKCINSTSTLRHMKCTPFISNLGGYCFFISYFVALISLTNNVSPEVTLKELYLLRSAERTAKIEAFIGWLLEKWRIYELDIVDEQEDFETQIVPSSYNENYNISSQIGLSDDQEFTEEEPTAGESETDDMGMMRMQ